MSDLGDDLERAATEANTKMSELDLGISKADQLAMLRGMFARYKGDFFQMKKAAALNRLVDNKELVAIQDEEARKLIVQLTAMDEEIKELEKVVEG